MIRYTVSGSTKRLESFLARAANQNLETFMVSGAKRGVAALRAATPTDEGIAQKAWDYKISKNGGVYSIEWINTNVENGFPVVIRLQYGYGTGTGGYVSGRDFINPAIKPVFDSIADDVWKAVKSL